jgi:hypothetical protein
VLERHALAMLVSFQPLENLHQRVLRQVFLAGAARQVIPHEAAHQRMQMPHERVRGGGIACLHALHAPSHIERLLHHSGGGVVGRSSTRPS